MSETLWLVEVEKEFDWGYYHTWNFEIIFKTKEEAQEYVETKEKEDKGRLRSIRPIKLGKEE